MRPAIITMGWKSKVAVVLALNVLLAAALAYYARTDPPIKDGTAQAFWAAAQTSRIYQTQDDWYVYYVQGFHGQFLYRIRKDVAQAELPAVVRRFENADEPPARPHVLRAYREWTRLDPGQTDADQLVSL